MSRCAHGKIRKSKTENVILIKDEQAVIRLGFVSFSPDYEAIEKTLSSNDGYAWEELSQYVEVSKITTTTQSKIKINNKRNASNNINQMDELLISEEEYKNQKLVA